MPPAIDTTPGKSRLGALLEHFAAIDDPRDVRRIAHPLPEVLLLVVCGTMADCDDYDHIAAWGEAHIRFLRRHLPYQQGVPYYVSGTITVPSGSSCRYCTLLASQSTSVGVIW